MAAMTQVVHITARSARGHGSEGNTGKLIEQLELESKHRSGGLRWSATYLIEEGGMEQPGTDANEQKAELGGNEPGMMVVTDNLAEAGEGKGYYKGEEVRN